jgi:hypothetical protein
MLKTMRECRRALAITVYPCVRARAFEEGGRGMGKLMFRWGFERCGQALEKGLFELFDNRCKG